MIEVTSQELSRELFKVSGWEYTDDRRHIEKAWMRYYSLYEMGKGHPDYERTPDDERRRVDVGDWHVKDNPRNLVSTGQEVFKWWYSEVRRLEAESFPAYDLSFLMSKLPPYTILTKHVSNYSAYTVSPLTEYERIKTKADTAADCLAAQAILLFQRGFLRRV